MKLYEVPKYSRIKVGGMVLDFHHIDGMYSYCTDIEGNAHHIAAWADAEVLGPYEDEAQPMSKNPCNKDTAREICMDNGIPNKGTNIPKGESNE